MKNLVQILVVIFLLAVSSTYAQKSFGIGIILGEPTGLSAKLWTGSIMLLTLVLPGHLETTVICYFRQIMFGIVGLAVHLRANLHCTMALEVE